ncbi:HAD family hydrolase [Desulfoscipio gibsoniae]|uniref:Haloacid dehalogenase superfamily enzyme, subfamily IA n=1 Tax=Desulfoscipio gibsoniae DSM 7213 TaxID=767817 RepID=R4KD94_9FIRM|nr:HAD family hydrolase [Desulfoscipio gibsoniae]AGL00534.1 haloacid dehalogenase superfamily enzyme, subfamily IA [Desulfoscipio gibsoniae DSM 7213]
MIEIMKNTKVISLDFEGTLVSFQWNITEAINETITILSEKGIPKEKFSNMNYAAIYNLVQIKGKEWEFPDNYLGSLLDNLYDRYDLDAASRWSPVQGLLDTLSRLKDYRIALVSNIGKKVLEQVLPSFNLQNSFGLVVTRNDVRLLKPANEGLLKVIDWAGVKKENIIHIGDSLSDLEAARDAGIKIGLVLGGENQRETLIQKRPDIVLNQLTELPAALKSINF